jgi:hypothetical protein
VDIWKPVPIPDFADMYEVSNTGYVRRVDTQRILKPMRMGSRPGGVRSTVRFSTNPLKDYSVAWLVLAAFVGPRLDGMVTMHRDDNTANNALANLRWGTQQDNARDMARKCRGGIQRVNQRTALEIIRRRSAGESGRKLAVEYGISEQRVCDLYKGRTVFK